MHGMVTSGSWSSRLVRSSSHRCVCLLWARYCSKCGKFIVKSQNKALTVLELTVERERQREITFSIFQLMYSKGISNPLHTHTHMQPQ